MQNEQEVSCPWVWMSIWFQGVPNGCEARSGFTSANEAVCALQIIKLCQHLPSNGEAQRIGKQILCSGTAVGAQYRESCRAKSQADFVSKMEGCLQELNETAYWLELLVEGNVLSSDKVADLQKETDELLAIFVSSVKKKRDEQRMRNTARGKEPVKK